MTKILIDLATAQQALEALEKSWNPMVRSAERESSAKDAIIALRTAMLQQPRPVQEPTHWRDMIVVTLVREGINKHKARELADHFAAQPEQEPVGEVVEVNNDGFRCEFSQRLAVGTKLYTFPPAAQPVQEPVACRFCHSKKGSWAWQCYKCGEIDDVQQPALPLPVQEPVGDEWTPCMKLPVVVHVRQQRPGESHVSTREGITPVKPDDLIMRGVSGEEYPIGRAIFDQTYSLNTTRPLPVQEPVAWMCNDFDGDTCELTNHDECENPIPLYTAPPQRPWVGLTDEEIEAIGDKVANEQLVGPVANFRVRLARAIEQTLKERNHG